MKELRFLGYLFTAYMVVGTIYYLVKKEFQHE